MSLKNILLRQRSFTAVAISHSAAVVYDTKNNAFEAKLTVSLEKPLKNFYQLLEARNDKEIDIILEPQGEVHQIVTLPDLGSIKTNERFKAIIDEMPYEVINYTTIKRATSKSPEWRFLVSGSHLANTTKTILGTLANIYKNNINIFSASSGYLQTCFKLRQLAYRRLKSQQKIYFVIYIRNSNNELYEFLFKNKKLININSMKSENSTLVKTINDRLSRQKKKLMSNNINPDSLFLIGLLPEPLRASISAGKNRIFFSPGEIFYNLTKKLQHASTSYSSTMLEINYINNRNKPAKIIDILPYSSLNKARYWWDTFTKSILITSALILLTIGISYYKSYTSLNDRLKVLAELNNEQKKELSYYQEKQELIKHNPQAQELYGVILSSHYSLGTMSKISQANTYNVPINRLTYNSDTHRGGIDIIVSNRNQTRSFFEHLDHFTKALSSQLPHHEILVQQLTNGNPSIQNQETNIAISIQRKYD